MGLSHAILTLAGYLVYRGSRRAWVRALREKAFRKGLLPEIEPLSKVKIDWGLRVLGSAFFGVLGGLCSSLASAGGIANLAWGIIPFLGVVPELLALKRNPSKELREVFGENVGKAGEYEEKRLLKMAKSFLILDPLFGWSLVAWAAAKLTVKVGFPGEPGSPFSLGPAVIFLGGPLVVESIEKARRKVKALVEGLRRD